MKLDNVHFVDPVAKACMPALLARFDAAYIGWRRQPLYRFGISPNKLIDYMMAGRPVLHAVEAGNDPVAEAGCGISVAPEDPDAVAAAVLALLALGPERRAALGRRGRAHALANHTYPVLGRRFLNALAGEPRHG
jgi:glycosyltransferase involved in cell wall biosynthesis